MNAELLDHLTDTVYRAAVERDAWDDVMEMMQEAFPSAARSFYFLDLAPRRIRPMSLAGVDRQWLSSFDQTYFSPDNPWFRFTRHLHQPGVVRTNEWLARFARDGRALYRSAYFNEWMRPQRLHHTLGSTLLAQHGVVANVTLLRPPDMPTYTGDEVAAFARLSAHMARALQVAVRLEQAETRHPGHAALDAVGHGVAVVDADSRLLHGNARMDAILREGHGLARCDGRFVATTAEWREPMEVLIRAAARDGATASCITLEPRRTGAVRYTVRAERVGATPGHYLPNATRVLLTVTRTGMRVTIEPLRLQELHGLTKAEATLVALLVDGRTLPEAAHARGIGYGTARGYLKSVFGKLGVHSQAQLAARVLNDLAADA